MEKDAANHLAYYASIPKKQQEELANIRHFTHLQLGFVGDMVWIKNLQVSEINDVALKTITSTRLYTEKQGRLYPVGSLLPFGNLPDVLWTPISRALPIEKPTYNHNYFGLNSHVKMELQSSELEKQSVALLADLQEFENYVSSAPQFRLQNLRWTIIGEKALVFGTPLLPINGTSFWNTNQFLIPTGYGFNFPLLQSELNEVINPANDFVLWTTDSKYSIIERKDIEMLSISSLRKTLKVK